MTPDLKVDLEDICGHKIYTLSYEASKHYSHVLGMADHIIAISPFLSLVGRHLYGNKISVLSLGVDCETFFVDDNTAKAERITVICAATAYDHKRPWLFVELAAANPDCDFIWYGVSRGATMSQVHNKIKGLGLTNINFKAPISHAQLAHEFRKAHLFVLPSMSEGVPKAAQEAAACGLPLILFGQYEAPTVVHGENGYVVWDDQEFLSTVSSAVQNKERLHKMSKKSAEMAKEWSWSRLAPLWQKEILAEI
jgi:glycosyltransferase involved in cell wall biosynthesis